MGLFKAQYLSEKSHWHNLGLLALAGWVLFQAHSSWAQKETVVEKSASADKPYSLVNLTGRTGDTHIPAIAGQDTEIHITVQVLEKGVPLAQKEVWFVIA